jgi:hypothetical protein
MWRNTTRKEGFPHRSTHFDAAKEVTGMLDMRRQLKKACAVVFTAWLGVCLLGQGKAQGQQSKEDTGQSTQYEVVVKGVATSRPLQIQFQTAAVRLEIRNLAMGRGQTEAIPTPAQILMELRQGQVSTVINQEKQERRQGDFWVVDKGSTLTLQNPGELAVIRAIYVFQGNP